MPDRISHLPRVDQLLKALGKSSVELAEEYLTPHDLSLAQWMVLSALWRQDGLNVSDLAQYTGNKVAALSRLLERMDAKHLVERKKSENDKRGLHIFLTPKARKLSHLIDMYLYVNDILLDDLDDRERAQAFRLLEKMLSSAEKALKRREG